MTENLLKLRYQLAQYAGLFENLERALKLKSLDTNLPPEYRGPVELVFNNDKGNIYRVTVTDSKNLSLHRLETLERMYNTDLESEDSLIFSLDTEPEDDPNSPISPLIRSTFNPSYFNTKKPEFNRTSFDLTFKGSSWKKSNLEIDIEDEDLMTGDEFQTPVYELPPLLPNPSAFLFQQGTKTFYELDVE
jgi:hypothetical protein